MAGRRILAVPIFLLVSALLFLSIGPGSGVKATNYDTTYQLILSSTVPGAVTDVQTVYQVGGDASVRNINFGSIYSATGYPEAKIVLDSDIVDGSSVGTAVNNATLSIFNGSCSSPITVTVPFMDCTTDTLKTAPWVGSGDNLVLDCNGNRNEDGSVDAQGDGNCIDTVDNPGPGDTDGLADCADPQCQDEVTDTNGLPTYCDHYPAFMNQMFNNIRPRARYMGHQVAVDGAPATMLDFVIFNPEALGGQPGVIGLLGDTYGFIDFVVLDNPVAAVSPSTITDFCSPLTSMPTLLGLTDGSYTVTPGPEPYENSRSGQCADALDNDSDGYVNDGCLVKNPAIGAGQQRSENPAAGTGLYGTDTHVVRTLSISQRDVDNDGISNNLDSCPYIVNNNVDADGDGLDSACDPNDGAASAPAPAGCTATSGIPDYDQDCYPDRQDICPLLFDNQSDTDNPPGAAAADLGPGLDAIGDACDVSVNTSDGHYHVAMPHTYVCIGGTDTDSDGVCDATEVLLGSNPAVAASLPEYIGLDLQIATGTAAEAPGTCSDFTVYNHPDTPAGGYDNDGDGNANAADAGCAPIASTDTDQDGVCDGAQAGTCVAGNDNCVNDQNQEQVDRDGDGAGDECDTDDDGDGFSDVHETNIGTDPKDACAELADGNDAWPLDFDQDRDADIVDVLKFKPVILKPLVPGGHRFDFDADGDADIVDVLKFKPYILTSCTAFPGNT